MLCGLAFKETVPDIFNVKNDIFVSNLAMLSVVIASVLPSALSAYRYTQVVRGKWSLTDQPPRQEKREVRALAPKETSYGAVQSVSLT